MTPAQIKTLSNSSYVTIGSHAYYHNDLAAIAAVDAGKELARSKTYLQSITGKEIDSIAFAYGSYNPQVLSLAKSAGYTKLLATEFNSQQDHHDISMKERLTINPFISVPNQLHATIRGRYN